MIEIPAEYAGWWRITETPRWDARGLDQIGTALISITGRGDRLRMHCLLAYVTWQVNRASLSFAWHGAWEFDEMSGRGNVKLGRNGRLAGTLTIKNDGKATFVAERADAPAGPIAHPLSWRDRWGSRRW